jgi:DNA-binding CsgD family transcriptional regulator
MAYRGIEGAESIGLGLLDLGACEKICCPEVDFHHKGEPNLPKLSCELKQQNPEMRTCYKGCKGKLPIKADYSRPIRKQKKYDMPVKAEAIQRAEKIVSLHQQGHSPTEIARKLHCRRETVYTRLAAYGLSPEKKVSLRRIILDYLNENPAATEVEISEKFSVKRGTVQTYRRDFINGLAS